MVQNSTTTNAAEYALAQTEGIMPGDEFERIPHDAETLIERIDEMFPERIPKPAPGWIEWRRGLIFGAAVFAPQTLVLPWLPTQALRDLRDMHGGLSVVAIPAA